jgi:RND superfamily putative drug exporter
VARYLYRLARWAVRRRRTVLALWIVVFIAAGAGAATLSGPTNDTFSLPGLESTRAFDLIKERAPAAAPDGAQAKIVFQAPAGEKLSSPENRTLVEQTLAAVKTNHVASIQSPFQGGSISPDGRTGFALIAYSKQGGELVDADRTALKDSPAKARASGLTVEIGGDALQVPPGFGPTEGIGVVVALLVLVVTFASLLAAGMPLLMALIGVSVGVSGITIATGFIGLSSSTPVLALMLGLAVGIDYALFIVSRYRHELAEGNEPEEAAGRAVGTAGSAVVVAGLTVIIALAGLSVVQIKFLTQMGLAAAGTVAVSVILAVTLLPAMLGFAGRRVAKNKLWFLRAPDPEAAQAKPTMGRRWVDGLLRRRGLTLAVGLIIAVIVAIPVASLQLALPDDGAQAKGTGPREAYDLVAKNFGAGANGPLLIVVDVKGVTDPTAAVDTITKAASTVKKDVVAVVPPQGTTAAAKAAYQKQLATTQLASITIIPKSGPGAAATEDLVADLRSAVKSAKASTGADVMVTGQTAVAVDVSKSLADAFPRYLALIVGLAFILLVLVFRSILVPLKAVVGFLVTILMTLGATVAVFQWGWFGSVSGVDEGSPVLSLLPILMTGILFGLAMDYELFLVTRMREEHAHGANARDAVATGFQHGARVVTAAAIIMLSVFGSFATAHDPIIKSIGFGLAFGILVDAFLVRMTLVPAFMALVGERMWWLPRWLDRVLPDLDVEGEKLTSHIDVPPASTADEPEPVPASR